MIEDPLVSIIICNYNYGRFLGEAIESALSQTYQNIEVIVVDDGSTDDSSSVISSFNGRITSVLKNNGGQASAFNAGFAVSNGEIIIFLDSDDTLLPEAVENAVPFFADEPVVKVHWPLWKTNTEGVKTGDMAPFNELPEGDLLSAVIKYGPEHWGASENSPLPSGHAWSRKLLNILLPMPEEEFRTGADYYLIVLAPIYGVVKRINEPQATYRMHGGNDTKQDLLNYIKKFLRWFDYSCALITDHLKAKGVDVDPDLWPRNTWLHKVNHVLMLITSAVPVNTNYVLIDGEQLGLIPEIDGRRKIPFLENEGIYWGIPANDEEAISEIQKHKDAAVKHLFIAWTAFWYFETYAEFHQYLFQNYRLCSKDELLISFSIG
jgi:glycosyltransferase involved in cell wall biosynthesis